MNRRKRTGPLKKAVSLVWLILAAAMLGGCWNYRSLDEMAIIAGAAIDKDPESGEYIMTFEFVNMTGNVKQEGPKTVLIESRGSTLFDAARNAKKRIINKLYFGHMETMIVSEQIARDEDMGGIINWFIRDAECRETMYVVISHEDTAAELLAPKGIGTPMVSYEIHSIIETDRTVTSSLRYMELYNIFNMLETKGQSLTLPAFHIVMNDEEPAVEGDGTAVFNGQRLVGFISPADSKSLLFVLDQVHGGVLSFSSKGEGPDNASLEISKNTTTKSFSVENGELKLRVKTETDAYLNELHEPSNALSEKWTKELEAKAEQRLASDIVALIQKVQTEFKTDIFGFGSMIHKQDVKLWEQYKQDWDKQFQTLSVEVECEINIVNTASIK